MLFDCKSAGWKIMHGRLRHRWKEVNVIVVEMWCEVMHRITVAQNRVWCWNCLITTMQLSVQILGIFLSIWNMICFCFLVITERPRFEDLNSSCAHCIHSVYVSLLSWKYIGTRD